MGDFFSHPDPSAARLEGSVSPRRRCVVVPLARQLRGPTATLRRSKRESGMSRRFRPPLPNTRKNVR